MVAPGGGGHSLYRTYGDVRNIWVGIFFTRKSVDMGIFDSEIYRNGYFLESVHMGLTGFIIDRHKIVKNCQKYHSFNRIPL